MSQSLCIKGYESAVGHDLLNLSYALVQSVKGLGVHQFVPDGDPFAATGTLNYYAFDGLPWTVPADIIVQAMTDLGFTVGPVVVNKSNLYRGCPTMRFPILANPTVDLEKAPELNICEGNVPAVLSLLGLTEEQTFWPVDDILQALGSIGSRQICAVTRPVSAETGSRGAAMYDGGLPFERANRYLERIEEIANWAKVHGYAELYLG